MMKIILVIGAVLICGHQVRRRNGGWNQGLALPTSGTCVQGFNREITASESA